MLPSGLGPDSMFLLTGSGLRGGALAVSLEPSLGLNDPFLPNLEPQLSAAHQCDGSPRCSLHWGPAGCDGWCV